MSASARGKGRTESSMSTVLAVLVVVSRCCVRDICFSYVYQARASSVRSFALKDAVVVNALAMLQKKDPLY